ncbi:MAG: AgmX/PglI C-terminal domain-containing protein [Bacteriovoracaceae bacterium]|jgi:hypothetical protein|nr:AgmX/PglI C-terminal domain-containing protein [Bacteriovoracaceae bacterium]
MFRLFLVFIFSSCSTLHDYSNSKKSRDVISFELQKAIPEMRLCYLESSYSKKEFQLKLNFEINKYGRVYTSRAFGSNLDKNFKKCILIELSKLEFPKPHDGKKVDVKQPINFFPK